MKRALVNALPFTATLLLRVCLSIRSGLDGMEPYVTHHLLRLCTAASASSKQPCWCVRASLPDTRTRETNHSSLPGWLDQAVRPRRAGHVVHACQPHRSVRFRNQNHGEAAGHGHTIPTRSRNMPRVPCSSSVLFCSPRWARLTRRSVIMAWDLHAGQGEGARTCALHGRGRERERE